MTSQTASLCHWYWMAEIVVCSMIELYFVELSHIQIPPLPQFTACDTTIHSVSDRRFTVQHITYRYWYVPNVELTFKLKLQEILLQQQIKAVRVQGASRLNTLECQMKAQCFLKTDVNSI